MNVKPVFTLVLLVVAGSLPAQEDTWTKLAKPRLQQIYEQGAFRLNPIRADWISDSECVVRRKNPNGRGQIIEKINVSDGTSTRLDRMPENKADQRLSPDGSYRIEYRANQLLVRKLDNKSLTTVAKHKPEKNIGYRQPKWSSDSTKILFIESDSTEVRERSMLSDNDPSYPNVRKMKFARVAEKINRLRVGVFDLNDHSLSWLPIPSPQEGIYLGLVEWAGNSNEVLIEWMSRFRDQRKFLLFDLEAQSLETIFEENSETWAISSRSINTGLHWIDQGKSFVVISEQEEFRRAFLYSRDGKKQKTLTLGNFDLMEHCFIDQTNDWYYFYASPKNATEQFLYRVALREQGKPERVTPNESGWHEYQFSPNGKWAVHTHSSFESPPRTELVEIDNHRVVKTLEKNIDVRKKLNSRQRPVSEFFQVNIDGGVSMDGWMIQPKKLDPTKKYPVLVYVYGEPYSQTVLNKWNTPHAEFHRLVAELGYVVVSFDNRGTPAPKGTKWRNSVFGSLGPISTEDQAAAIKALGRKYSFVDLDRVGIWGWSGGGSNTLNAMFRKPETYKVGIAVVPKPQPHLYNAWFQEIYMRTPEVNPDGYRKSAPINFAKGLQGKLLIITGSGETNTHVQIVEGLVDRLIELGKPFDYMVYPHRDHGLRRGRGTSVHLRMLMIRYLEDHLKPE